MVAEEDEQGPGAKVVRQQAWAGQYTAVNLIGTPSVFVVIGSWW